MAMNPGTSMAPGEEQPTAEEQSEYDQVEAVAHTALFKDKKSRDAVIEQLKAGKDDPAKALADTAMTLLKAMDAESNGTLPEITLLPIGKEIMEQAGEIADAAGIFTVDQNVFGKAGQHFMMLAAQEYGMTPEDAKEIMAGVDEQTQQSMKTEQEGYWKDTPLDQGGMV